MKNILFLKYIALIIQFFFQHCFSTTQIIVSNWPEWSECSSNISLSSSNLPNYFSGFLADIFLNVLPSDNYKDFKLNCLEWNETANLLANLTENSSYSQNEYIFLGPLPIISNKTYSKTSNNAIILPTYPVYSSHLYLVQQPLYSLEIYFYYMRGFDIGLWFFILLLLFVAAHLLWFFERSDDNKMPLRYLEGIKEAIWLVFLYFFLMGNRPIRSLPGRTLIGSLFVTSYILMVYFMGSTVSRMMYNYEYINFSTLGTLKNSDNVYTFEGYEQVIQNYNTNVRVSTYEWNVENIEKIMNNGKNEKDHIFVPNFLAEASINSSCSLKKSTAYIKTNFYLSFLYTNNINSTLITALNEGIIALRNNYKYNVFYNKRFLFDNNMQKCNKASIDFSEMYGIWIIFICGVFFSLVSFGIRLGLKKWVWKNEDNYEKIFGKNPLRRGFKRLIYEEKKLIQQALIEYFDRILMIYESKHKEILKNLKGVVEEKRDSIEKVEEKLKDLYSQID